MLRNLRAFAGCAPAMTAIGGRSAAAAMVADGSLPTPGGPEVSEVPARA